MTRRRQRHRPVASAPGGRALHLVDVDNPVGDPLRATPASIRSALAGYRAASGYRRDDLVILATNPGLALEVGLAWPGARLLSRRGTDGADLALIDEARALPALAGIGRVVIGSGDHIFGEVVRELRRTGIVVAVVSRREALARSLRAAADGVGILPSHGFARRPAA